MPSFNSQFQKYMLRLGRNLTKGGYVLEGEMKNIVAIDTGDLKKDIDTSPLSVTGSILKVSVGTEKIDYAPDVEDGKDGQIFQYHRREGANRTVIWVGVGMQYMKRSVEKTKNNIFNLLKSTRI